MNVETSAPSAIPAVEMSARLSTVHSTYVALALLLEADERIGVSSGAKMVKTSIKSSRLETADPVLLVSYVFENAIIYRVICKVLNLMKSSFRPELLNLF